MFFKTAPRCSVIQFVRSFASTPVMEKYVAWHAPKKSTIMNTRLIIVNLKSLSSESLFPTR